MYYMGRHSSRLNSSGKDRDEEGEMEDSDEEDPNYTDNYFIQIDERGCTDSHYLCVSGRYYNDVGMSYFGGDYFSV